jgi:hypothetical protein
MESINHHTITYNGKCYIIERHHGESLEQLYKRSSFIAKQSPKTSEEFEQVVQFSKIWINVIQLNCKYSEDVMNKLDQMVKKNNC